MIEKLLNFRSVGLLLRVGLLVGVVLPSLGCGADPPASTLLQPPPVVAPTETSATPLLRGSLDGWKVDGSATFASDNLILGGAATTTLTYGTLLPPGSKLAFDLFRDGDGGFRVAAVLPEAELATLPGGRLDEGTSVLEAISGFGVVCKRWKHGELQTAHGGGHVSFRAVVASVPGCDGLGGGGNYECGFPCSDDVRFRFSFVAYPGAKLYIRNVFLELP